MQKTILITGAAKGIGRACALAFAKADYSVAVNYLKSEKKAKSLVSEIHALGCDADCFRCDVSSSQQVFEMKEWMAYRFGHADVLINNAGAAHYGLLSDLSDSDWAKLRGVDLDGVLFCCREFLPQMISRKSGAIINISSVWGVRGGSCEAAYSAAKAGIIGLTRALAKEVAPSNVRVNCIAPGVIDTEMCAHLDRTALASETPLGRLGTPADVADAALFLARASFITGHTLAVDGGFGL